MTIPTINLCFLLALVIAFSYTFKNLFTSLSKNNFISKNPNCNIITGKNVPIKCLQFQFNNFFCPVSSSFLKNLLVIGAISWNCSMSWNEST